MNLQTLIEELETQKPLKWDRKLNAAQIAMALAENTPILRLPGEELFSITKPCHTQFAEKLEIPLKYYHKMRNPRPTCSSRTSTPGSEKTERTFLSEVSGIRCGRSSATATG